MPQSLSWTRRRCLQAGLHGGLTTAVASLGLLGAPLARAAVTDYKALVCVYLYGGNDGNNLIVPLDTAHYTAYQSLRASSGLALSIGAGTLLPARSAVLQGVPGNIEQPFAFHSSLAEVDALYAQGKVAVLLNTGSLLRPLSKTDYHAGVGVPGQLFSHSDQTVQTQQGLVAGDGTGWGGRLLDACGPGGPLDAAAIDFSGVFPNGRSVRGNLVPASGDLSLAGMSFWPQREADLRKQALLTILNAPGANTILNTSNQALRNGIDVGTTLQAALSGAAPRTVFPATSLGNQLKLVARLIAARAPQGPGRQVYFVSLGGFDTHAGQSYQQGFLLAQVSQAMAAFQAAMEEFVLGSKVTSLTLSEFGRTLAPAGSGTDHGWGSHQLVVGGAVHGGLYGEFPNFALRGPDDATGRGAWIPRWGLQQVGATLGRWFGVGADTLATDVFGPELVHFEQTDLGFV